MKMTDEDIRLIIEAERAQSLSYLGEGSKMYNNAKTLLDYYYQKPFGNEQPGMSHAISSDVSDVVEGMLPNLLRMFFQGRNFGEFAGTQITGNLQEQESELEQRTAFANWVFSVQNKGFSIFHNFLKDGLLQYFGVVKVCYIEKTERKPTYFSGATVEQLQQMKLERPDLLDDAKIEENEGGTFDLTVYEEKKYGQHKLENVATEDFRISNRADDIEKPPFIGQESIKTRSELLKMGFDKKVVMSLVASEKVPEELDIARSIMGDSINYGNPTKDKSRDELLLGEYYLEIDVDGDGLGEYYQIFYCDGKILEKTEVYDHPFALFTPVPLANQVIGTCPADQVADLQFMKSELLRQALTNIYSTNFNRFLFNNRANPEHLFHVAHGGGVHVDDSMPVDGVVSPLPVMQQVTDIMQMIAYVDTLIEKRTGITSYNQGLDSDALNKTATGFKGVRDMSQMRIELIARHAATAGQRIFELIDKNARRYQNDEIEIMVNGSPIKFSPQLWGCEANFNIDVGLGSGDRQEKVMNLNYILDKQMEMIQLGMPLSDPQKMYNTLDKVCIETGLKDAQPYFNDVTKPEQTLAAENFQMQKQLEQFMAQAQAQNPLAEAAKIEQETEAFKSQLRMTEKQMDLEHKEKMRSAEMMQEQDQFSEKQDLEITKAELQYKKDLQGGLDERRQGQEKRAGQD